MDGKIGVEFIRAFSMAQKEMPGVKLNAKNTFVGNRYADLGEVINTIKPVLSKYGLSFSQMVTGLDGEIGIVTIIMHESGEYMTGTVMLPISSEKGKSFAQVGGSIISYLKRYSLGAAFGLVVDEDTDGNDPQGKQRQQSAPKKAAPPKDWPDAVFKKLVDDGPAQHENHAKNRLSYIAVPKTVPYGTVKRLVKYYQAFKDEGMTSAEAGKAASKRYMDALKKRGGGSGD